MPFQTGRSGNPSGRPKGIQDRRTLFQNMVEPSAPKLIEKAVGMALEGNEHMLKILLDRLLPAKPKDDIIDINLSSGSLIEKATIVLKELNDKNITSTEARDLLCMITMETKIYEMEEKKSRIVRRMKLYPEF